MNGQTVETWLRPQQDVDSGPEGMHGTGKPARARTCQSLQVQEHFVTSGLGSSLPPSVLRFRILTPAPSRHPALAAAMAAAPPLSKAEYLKRYLSGADADAPGGSESGRKRRKKRLKPGGAGGKG